MIISKCNILCSLAFYGSLVMISLVCLTRKVKTILTTAINKYLFTFIGIPTFRDLLTSNHIYCLVTLYVHLYFQYQSYQPLYSCVYDAYLFVGGGVCIGNKIAPIFYNTMEDSGALPLEMSVDKMNTGMWMEWYIVIVII